MLNRMISTVDGTAHDSETQDVCVREAIKSGTKSALTFLALSSVVVLGSVKFFPMVRKSLGTSGRTALIVSPAFAAFFLDSELTMSACARRKQMLARGFAAA